MGLDSYWVMPGYEGKRDEQPVPEELEGVELNLCGGMLSANGLHSFRGKVYDGFICVVAGEEYSLYTEEMPNEDVCVIADSLEAYEWDHGNFYEGSTGFSDFEVSIGEFQDLKKMFRAYADAGAVLKGWW